ncbi:chondroadherin isoform X2 [Lingula anatina]|uniref:Chondroadherin isoform X2 n=1 Tax=Lingula anatina TaxID=7574 RepID=A0A1S3HFI8_LINAN|nr:chondroadherin isoform X2 [Lingula anatina]|eukprot:XP_013384843.1 chondroadherin isoform X2 [Lingula anatina]
MKSLVRKKRHRLARMASVRFLLSTFVYVIVQSWSLIYGCPNGCECIADSTVRCKDILSIPSDIPTNTRTLNLDRSRITTIPTHAFSNLPKLQDLTIEYANVSVIESMAFMGLKELSSLSLRGNPIRTLEPHSLSGIESVIYFHLRDNPIEEIKPNAFSGSSKIDYLYLSSTKLRKIHPGAFNQLSNVQSFILTDNKHLGELTNASFLGLSNVDFLTFSRSNISIIRNGAFMGMSNVKKVNLENCGIQGWEAGAFGGVTGDVQYSLQNNQIKTFARNEFSGLKSTSLLNLNKNPIVCDCDLKWVLDSTLPMATKATIVCAMPEELKGRTITSLTGKDLTCITTTAPTSGSATLRPVSNPTTKTIYFQDNWFTKIVVMLFFQVVMWFATGNTNSTGLINATVIPLAT